MRHRKHVSKPAPRRGSETDTDPLGRLLLHIVDAGLAGSIFVVPFLMAGRHPLGQLVLIALAVSVAVAWILRESLRGERTWRLSGAELLLLAGLVLLLMQLAPLPQSLLSWLAPHTTEVLPLWRAEADPSVRLGIWSQVSLTPAATRSGLVMFLAYGLLFLATAQRIRRVEDVERLLRWCALSATVMAVFGIAHLLLSNGKFFWFYEHPYSTTSDVAKGSFSNRNHFAHFLALGVGPLVWCAYRSLGQRRNRRKDELNRWGPAHPSLDRTTGFWVMALVLVLFAALLSLSRGGAIVAVLATLISVAVCFRGSGKGIRFVIGLGAAALLVGASLAIFGGDRVSSRLRTLAAGSLEEIDAPEGRLTIWKAAAKAVPDFAVLGSGVGSHREVYPMYLQQRRSRKYFSHCESGYLQVALETGIPGLALILAGIGLCGYWCISGLRTASSRRALICFGAVSASLAVSIVHSLVDFVWYVPACMAMAVLLAACACRLWQLAGDRPVKAAWQIRFPRSLGLAAASALLAAGMWMVKDRVGPLIAAPHWDQFCIMESSCGDVPIDEYMPAGGSESDLAGDAPETLEKRMIAELEKVVRWDPDHPRARLELAGAYLRLFYLKQRDSVNAMPINQIRGAAFRSQSHFDSPEDFDAWLRPWLLQAVGDHAKYLDSALTHTREALRVCPLIGEGYLYLCELCFLDGGTASTPAGYVAQILKVRPRSGRLLFHAGKEALLAGDAEQSLICWQRAFQCGPVYQGQILDYLVGRSPPEELSKEIEIFLRDFHPDFHALRLLLARYEKIARPEQLVALREAYAQAAEAEAARLQGEEAAAVWLLAMYRWKELRDPARGVACGRRGLACAPNHSRIRYELACCLVEMKQFTEAEEHLTWLVRRQPDDEKLQSKLREVVAKRIGGEDRASSTGTGAGSLRIAGSNQGGSRR